MAKLPQSLESAAASPASQASPIERWIDAEALLSLEDLWPPSEASAFDQFYTDVLKHARVDPSRSLVAVQKALEVAALSQVDRYRAMRLQAHAWLVLGRASDSCQAYAAVLKAFRGLGRKDEVLRTGIGYASALGQAGKVGQAVKVCRGLRRAYGSKESPELARLMTTEAFLLSMSGSKERAARGYERSWLALKRLGLHNDAALAGYNLGHARLMLGDPAHARAPLLEALHVFERTGRTHQRLYCEFSLVLADLLEDRWEGLNAKLEAIRGDLAQLGDVRAEGALLQEQAEFFAVCGVLDPAEQMARRAFDRYRGAGLTRDAAQVAYLHGRILSSLGRFIDARARFNAAAAYLLAAQDRTSLYRVRIEEARLHIQRGESVRALRPLRRARGQYLRHRSSPVQGRPNAVERSLRLCAGTLLVRVCLERGRPKRARDLATGLLRYDPGYPARGDRPWLALSCAQGALRSGDNDGHRRWLDRAVKELERVHRDLQRAAPLQSSRQLRDRFLGHAVRLAMETKGVHGPRQALDLLSRVEGLDLGPNTLGSGGTRSWLRGVAQTRNRLLSLPKDQARQRALEGEKALAQRAGLREGHQALPSSQIVRCTEWSTQLSESSLVYYHEQNRHWSAFVVTSHRERVRVRHVDLPDAQRALREHWFPLRMALERAAHLDPSARTTFLAAIASRSNENLAALAAALWRPLGLPDGEVTLVPHGALHGLPLEALGEVLEPGRGGMDTAVSRLPHPQWVLRKTRRPRQPARRRHALILHDGSHGTRREVEIVRRRLQAGGMEVQTASTANRLQEGPALDVLHVAAHGAYYQDRWLLSGIKLEDGWLGFEQLPKTRLQRALLCFSSCESGLNHDAPGAELGGWGIAGLAAGACGVVLSLWKIDDQSAREFMDTMYAEWLDGVSLAKATARARGRVRTERPHLYRWGPFVCIE